MKDGLVLFYVKDDVVYPVAMSEEQFFILQFIGRIFNPVEVINKPQGNAINLLGGENR